MTLEPRRYIATFIAGTQEELPLYAAVCNQQRSGQGPRRQLGFFLGLIEGEPLYAVSNCEFPQMGRYLMRYVGFSDLPIYAIVCCNQSGERSWGYYLAV